MVADCCRIAKILRLEFFGEGGCGIFLPKEVAKISGRIERTLLLFYECCGELRVARKFAALTRCSITINAWHLGMIKLQVNDRDDVDGSCANGEQIPWLLLAKSDLRFSENSNSFFFAIVNAVERIRGLHTPLMCFHQQQGSIGCQAKKKSKPFNSRLRGMKNASALHAGLRVPASR